MLAKVAKGMIGLRFKSSSTKERTKRSKNSRQGQCVSSVMTATKYLLSTCSTRAARFKLYAFPSYVTPI